jgi:hypothetical protein
VKAYQHSRKVKKGLEQIIHQVADELRIKVLEPEAQKGV